MATWLSLPSLQTGEAEDRLLTQQYHAILRAHLSITGPDPYPLGIGSGSDLYL